MLPYFLLYAALAIAAIKSAVNPGQTGRYAVWAAAVLLIVLIGFRFQVGGDWWNYLYIMNYIRSTDLAHAVQRVELSYAFLNWLAVRIGWGIWFPNLICAIIFTWGLVQFCRNQPNFWLALVIALPYFIIGVGMGYTRQSAALGLILLALNDYSRGSSYRMLFKLALAVTFHISAVVMIPIIAVAAVRRGAVTIAMVLILGAGLLYFFRGGFETLLDRYTAETYTSTGAVPRLAMNVIPALLFLAFWRRLARSPQELRLWTTFSYMALFTLFLLLLLESSTIVDRLGIYLVPLQIFVLSRLPSAFGTSSKPSLAVLGAILLYSLAVQIVWLNFGTYSKPWLPYRNYLWDSGVGKAPPRWFRRG